MTARHENQSPHLNNKGMAKEQAAAKETPPEHTFDGGIFDGGVFGVCPADDKD